jgi:hypothetical protein
VTNQSPTPVCANHPQFEAAYQCEQCLKEFCDQCVNQDAHLFFCKDCGAHVRRIVAINNKPIVIIENAATTSTILRNIALGITNHILVPLALILMVSAFLFYLSDVRSVYIEGSESLKSIGFFFVVATILIARYGKVYQMQEKQVFYTGALALATLFALSKHSGGGIGFIVNIAIIMAAWKFATSVTNNLDLVEEEIQPNEIRLYGVARLHHEAIEKKHNLNKFKPIQPQRPKPQQKGRAKDELKKILTGSDAHGNPASSVAKLAMLAIVVFALGEPALLAGPKEIGLRALVTVIVFLLSTGIVLAAASSAGTFKYAVSSGGKASLGMVPLKITLSLFLLISILAVGLSVPGLQYIGKGYLQPKAMKEGKGNLSGKEKNRGNDAVNKELQKEIGVENQESRKNDSDEANEADKKPSGSFVQKVFSFFAAIGKLLLIPIILLFIGFIVYVLFQLMPLLKGAGSGIGDRLRQWMAMLRGLLKFRKSSPEGQEELNAHPDPLQAMRTINTLDPRDAVLTAYRCLLGFLERSGHKYMPRLTPYEVLSSLPPRLEVLTQPARIITNRYISTAFSTGSPSLEESKEVIDALFAIQLLDEKVGSPST